MKCEARRLTRTNETEKLFETEGLPVSEELFIEKQKEMKNKKILLAALAVIVIAIAYIAIAKPFAPKAAGTIRIFVTDENEKVLADKKIKFYAGDTLPDLIEKNFKNVLITESSGMKMLMNIETLETPADWSKWIAFYINKEMAAEGIGTQPFKDGDEIEFRMTVYDPAAFS